MLVRFLTLVLLAANLLLFLWAYPRDRQTQEQASAPPLPAGIAEIALYSGPSGPNPEPSDAEPAADDGSIGSLRLQAPSACLLFGPFAHRSEGSEAAAWFRTQGLEAGVETASGGGEDGYRLLVDRGAQDPNAFDARLVAAGLDAGPALIHGDLAGFVPLGDFHTRDAAQERSDAVSALGFSPRIEPRSAVNTRFWVRLEGDRPDAITGGYPGSQGAEKQPQTRACTPVVSTEGLP